MKLRRGFKAEAERLSAEIRSELELTCTDRLDPRKLAEHLALPLVGLSRFPQLGLAARAALFFLHTDTESLSAFTLFVDGRRVIVHNDAHAPPRQASDIAHEVAHCILEHPPSQVVSAAGMRHVDVEVEDEADWTAAALLVPRDGAVALLAKGLGLPDIAAHFGVSVQLAGWRVNGTGAAAQIRRAQSRRAHR